MYHVSVAISIYIYVIEKISPPLIVCLLCMDKRVAELVLKLKVTICSLRLDTLLYSYRFKVWKHLHDSAEIFDLLSTWQISQRRPHTVVQPVGSPLNKNIVWIYTREFIQGKGLINVELVWNLLNRNKIWLYIWEFIQGIGLMCVLYVTSHA